MSTASLDGARDHARRQAGAVRADAAHGARDGGDRPPRRRRAAATSCGTRRSAPATTPRAELPAGTVAAHRRRRRRRLRAPRRATTPRDPAERLNVADTVKVQWQAYLGAGAVLLSDMGRALMTIVADTSARHDALCGATSAAVGRDAATAHGGIHSATPTVRELLDRRRRQARPRTARPADRASTCSSRRRRRRRRRAARSTAHPRPGAAVELRAEMDVVVLLANVPAPARRPRRRTPRRPCALTAWRGPTDRAGRPAADVEPRARSGPSRTPTTWLGSRRDDARPSHRRRSSPPAPRGRASCAAGQTLRIVDLGGNQAVDCLLYNAARHRPSATRPPTRSPPRATSSSSPARCCAPTRARPMMTIVDTTCARHDTIGGACSRESNTLRYGHHTRHQHACVENFLAAGARHGLGKRDLVSNINWFMNVPVGADGTLGIVDGISAPGPVRRRARRDGRARADLQLPADQQPVQRVRPDADPGHRQRRRRDGHRRPAAGSSTAIAGGGDVEVARRRAADDGAGPARAGSATGTSACRRAGRWTTSPTASPTASSATPRAPPRSS